MEPGSTNPVTYLAGFLIGWGSVILPIVTITTTFNDNTSQLRRIVLDGSGHELYSTSQLETMCPNSRVVDTSSI